MTLLLLLLTYSITKHQRSKEAKRQLYIERVWYVSLIRLVEKFYESLFHRPALFYVFLQQRLNDSKIPSTTYSNDGVHILVG